MIWGPENQQIRPSARHNGEAELPVDVFEERSSFFSVSTSLPPHTHTHLQHKPACNACSHAANEEARELCVTNTCAPLLHAGAVREVSEWRGVLCSMKPSLWLGSKVKVFRIVSRKRHEDGCDADAALCKKTATNVTKTCRFSSRLQTQLKIITQTQTKLDLRSASLQAAQEKEHLKVVNRIPADNR